MLHPAFLGLAAFDARVDVLATIVTPMMVDAILAKLAYTIVHVELAAWF